MKTVQVTKQIENHFRLHREIKADETLSPLLIDLVIDGDKLTFYFEDAFDSANETYLRFTFLENFVDEDNEDDFQVRIYDFVTRDIKKHFHNINYKNEVNFYWFRQETWGTGSNKGLLEQVDYFSDPEKQNLILRVEVEYVQDQFGNLFSKNTVRRWVMNNGEFHPEAKEKPSPKIYTPTESRQATMRRRQNIVAQLEAQLIQLLTDPEATLEENQASLTLGVQFLTAVSSELNEFYNSGNITGIVTFVNNPLNHVTFPFLLTEVAPTYTVAQFIIDGVTY